MRIEKDSWLITRPIAHRGLWGNGVIENSVTAYELAAKKHYPIEIDLYKTTDDELVSFHDNTLNRMTGKDGFIYEKSLAELKNLRLSGTNEKIPTFNEVLEIAKNRSPLLIEIKNQPDKTVVDSVVKRLKDYNGEFAVQSFNPFYINRVKKLAPEFIRGILGNENAFGEKAINKFVVKNLSFNFLIKPDFISYSYTGLPLPKKKTKNKVILCWTVRDSKTEKAVKDKADNIIYENFVPEKYLND